MCYRYSAYSGGGGRAPVYLVDVVGVPRELHPTGVEAEVQQCGGVVPLPGVPFRRLLWSSGKKMAQHCM